MSLCVPVDESLSLLLSRATINVHPQSQESSDENTARGLFRRMTSRLTQLDGRSMTQHTRSLDQIQEGDEAGDRKGMSVVPWKSLREILWNWFYGVRLLGDTFCAGSHGGKARVDHADKLILHTFFFF